MVSRDSEVREARITELEDALGRGALPAMRYAAGRLALLGETKYANDLTADYKKIAAILDRSSEAAPTPPSSDAGSPEPWARSADPDAGPCPKCGHNAGGIIVGGEFRPHTCCDHPDCMAAATPPSSDAGSPNLRGYPVTLYREPEDGSWSVMAPDLPGHVGAAMTIPEVLSEAADAMAAWIESCEASGMPVPPPSDPYRRDAGSPIDVERLARALHAALVCNNWSPGYGYLDENMEHHDDHGPAEHTEARRIAAEYDAIHEGPATDAASELGRLLAERDRLIADGVDPADLLVPDSPDEGPAEPEETPGHE